MKGAGLSGARACSFLLALSLSAAAVADSLITPGAVPVVVHSAGKFFEGPTWDPITGHLYFTSLTEPSEILRLTLPSTVDQWFPNSQGINGTFLSRDCRLLACQGNTRRILSIGIGPDGPTDTTILAEDADWQMPNDLCQAPNGDIYFTTPDFAGQTDSVVYHLSPAGVLTPVVSEMTICNGVITSLDGLTLYVSDSAEKWWRSYPINPDGTVGAGSVFFNPDTPSTLEPDGMTIDELGNLYFCGRGGVWIVSPAGQQLELIDDIPVFITNVTFGGHDGRTLYITGNGLLYSLSMEVRGGLFSSTPAWNQVPQVDAGADGTVTTRVSPLQLDATVTDDGLPDPPAAVTTKWFQISGPGQASFTDPSAIDTAVTFSHTGTYVLQLTAYDGLRAAYDRVSITIVQVGDLDDDTDVDPTDVSTFKTCTTGADLGPPAPNCELADIDTDDDVDQSDFGLLQRCLSGQGNPANPRCAD